MVLNNNNICLAHESEFGQSSVWNISTLLHYEAAEKPGKLEAASSEGPLLTYVVVDAGCQLRPPQGLWLKHIHSLACGWVPRVNIPKGSETILTFITQPQKPHVTPIIVHTYLKGGNRDPVSQRRNVSITFSEEEDGIYY